MDSFFARDQGFAFRREGTHCSRDHRSQTPRLAQRGSEQHGRSTPDGMGGWIDPNFLGRSVSFLLFGIGTKSVGGRSLTDGQTVSEGDRGRPSTIDHEVNDCHLVFASNRLGP